MDGCTVSSRPLFALRLIAEDIGFATTSDEIIQALQGHDGRTVVRGETYVVENGRVYKLIAGKKVRMRGVGGVVERKLAPKVALQILFETDSARVAPASQALIAELAKAMHSPKLAGRVFSFAATPMPMAPNAYNMDLSLRRARQVRKILIERHGVAPANLDVQAYGERMPIADNASAAGKAKNRRVEILRKLE